MAQGTSGSRRARARLLTVACARARARVQECFKCTSCSTPLQTRFANVAGKPMCIDCAKKHLAAEKAARANR